MRLFNNVSQPTLTKAKSIKKDGPTDGVVVEDTGLSKGTRERRLIQRFGPTNQPNISEHEIREKLMNSTEAARKKQAALKKATRESSTFMEEKKVVGDVGLNDPKDGATVGKLKDLISSGGFSFSDKERSVLSEILKDQ